MNELSTEKMQNVTAIVRPVVLLLFAGAVVVGFLYLRLISGEMFMTAAMLILGAFFGERAALKQPTIRCPLNCPTCEGRNQGSILPTGSDWRMNRGRS